MNLVSLHEKREIEAFVGQNPFLHLFELGDLDDFFWPHTIWYALKEQDAIRQLALVYMAGVTPVLMANPNSPLGQMRELLHGLLPLLPRRIYTHLHPAHVDVMARNYAVQERGLHYKMGLFDPPRLDTIDSAAVTVLSAADLPALEQLYHESYPENFFSARMLQSGYYYGVRQGETLVSVAGVHVYSKMYRTAALGNVTTHPTQRGKGLGRAICARLCRDLLRDGIEHIGLIVKADNRSAITLYEELGFKIISELGVYLLDGKP
ncbi:MAG: GNAT family N-acetyltransferase [Chloroflexales bacterium]|nr:GNAT family N-acetyltransferase [Chloroflexales bacterium]